MTNIAMTPKQQRFVEEYLVDLNATQAAVRAGYSEKTARSQGQRLLTNVDIAMAIEAGQAERSERTEVTQDYVLNSIMETIERCKQAEPVRYKNGDLVYVATPDGDIAPAYKFDAAAVLKGSELLGRHLAMFTDKLITKNAAEGMTDEELDASIAELQREVGTSQRAHSALTEKARRRAGRREAVDHVSKHGTSYHLSKATRVLVAFACDYGVSLDYLIADDIGPALKYASIWLKETRSAADAA